MKLPESVLSLFLTVTFAMGGNVNIMSQADTTNQVRVTQDKKDTSAVSRHSLFTGAGYGSNMIWLGSTISQNQPFSYGSIAYGFNNELYVTFSAVHLSEMAPYLAFYSGSLSYNHVFNKWFDISAGLNRYEVVTSLTDTLFGSFTYADFTLGFDWKLLYTKMSVGGLMSYDNQLYVQVRNSRYFQTPYFFKGKANISFDPFVNLLMGTYTQAETSEGTPVVLFPPYRKWQTSYSQNSTTTYSRRFGFLDLDMGLPVSLNTGFMTIEAEAGYVLPIYKDSDYPRPEGFIFLLSAFFRIF